MPLAFLLLVASQSVDTAGTGNALEHFAQSCRTAAQAIWGPSLCGPIALVDPRTRLVITNSALPGAGLTAAGTVWTGRLPDSVLIANTAFRWQGTDIAMVMLPLPSDAFDRAALLAHESFHRIQKSLDLSASDAPSLHLDSREGRTWLRLEVQALDYALTTRGPAQRRHIRAALLFRDHRRQLFAAAAAVEDSLEVQEGLAEYTGQFVASRHSPLAPLRSVRAIDAVMRQPSYVRSFAYATGPAYGLLLDRLAPGWRRHVRSTRSLTRLMHAAIGNDRTPPTDADLVATAGPYGYAGIASAELQRETERNVQTAAVLQTLVAGPVLRLQQQELNRSFNPSTLIAMDSLGVAYPTGEFSAAWGKLTVTEESDGALLAADFGLLRVAAPAPPASMESRVLRGKGWVLELAEGWVAEAGERAGDLRVVRRR